METTQIPINIRPATKDDMPQVHHFIKDLAKHEKMEHLLELSVDSLTNDGFDSNPPYLKCLIAELASGQIIGSAMYHKYYSTSLGKSLFLRQLYVEEKFRKLGVGKRLLQAVAGIALEIGHRIDFYQYTWSHAVGFFQRFGAENISTPDGLQVYYMDELALKTLLDLNR